MRWAECVASMAEERKVKSGGKSLKEVTWKTKGGWDQNGS
jgi:hypothetical protein